MSISKAKGDQRRDEADKSVLTMPIKTSTLLANLLDWYLLQRTNFFAENYYCPPPPAVRYL
jgi:hypothetical protein